MKKTSETILVTGGAGFIGSHLVDRLLSLGYFVLAVDNFQGPYPARYKYENISAQLKNKRYHLAKVDIRSRNTVEQLFSTYTIDRIIHLAARAGVRASLMNPHIYQDVNIAGTYNLLFLAKKFATKQFIFTSSSSIYGNAPVPFKETLSVKKPLSIYAATKQSGELACYAFHTLYGIPVTILRLFSVYGPRGRPDMAPYLFTESILQGKLIHQFGSGEAKRDWTYINDIVEGFIFALDKPKPFEIFNLGNSKPVSLSALLTCIEDSCQKKALIKRLPRRPEEGKITYASIDKARALLGWSPKVQFEKGIEKFVHWYKKNRLKG